MNGTVIVTCARSGSTNVGPRAELLDHAEDVVPAAGVQAGSMLAQLVEDLLHLEGGEDGLDQDRCPDRALRDAELVLREDEGVVPEPRLEVALELRQVEVRPRAALEQLAARCGRRRGRSRRGSPRPARRRPARGARAGASRAGARRASPVSSFSRYALLPGLELDRAARPRREVALARRRSSPRSASSASSKSAMKTRAPELSALIIILRSTGPVISTRRSSGPAERGATRQSPSRTDSSRAGSPAARRRRARPAAPPARSSSSRRGGVQLALQQRDEGERVGREDLRRPPERRPRALGHRLTRLSGTDPLPWSL